MLMQASPYDSASALSKLTFWWLQPTISLAHKQGLVRGNVPPVSTEMTSAPLAKRLNKHWKECKDKGPSHWYLALALFQTLKWDYFYSFFPLLLANISNLVVPVLVEKIIIFTGCTLMKNSTDQLQRKTLIGLVFCMLWVCS